MTTSRLEAFSDGVLAIIITIMVLALPTPKGGDFSALFHDTGLAIVAYLVSFIYVGIYWNNHHHLLQVATKVDGAVLWANLALLFMLSLIPFTTGWMSETELSRDAVALYGINLLGAALTFIWLERALVRVHGAASALAKARIGGWKERASLALYCVGTGAAFLDAWMPGRAGTWVGVGCFVAVALLWLIPDRRLARQVAPDAPAA